MNNLVIRSVTTWVLFIPVAITNGIIREKVYEKYVGDLAAHQISTNIAAIAFLLLVSFIMKKQFVQLEIRKLLLIGLMWVLMTIVFEFGFGHYIDHQPWNLLFYDYNILDGRIWSLFLLVVFISPLAVKKLE